MPKIVLSVRNVTKSFSNRVAVDNVSFDIHEGEIFGLIGPNGSGKTTLIRSITGLAKMDNGSVYICGHDISKKFEKAIINVGGIIEEPSMYAYMSGLDNLKYYASLYGKTDVKKLKEIATIVGMEKRIKHKLRTYSLGMKQRLGIAQALIHKPKILILDEPTNGLDPNGIKEMRLFLRDLAKTQNISILISSHILPELELLCDTIGIINQGRLIEIKTMQELQQGTTESERIGVKVQYPNYAGKCIMDEFKIPVEIVGNTVIIKPNNVDIQEILRFLISKNISIFGANVIKKTLEQVYMDLVTERGKMTAIY